MAKSSLTVQILCAALHQGRFLSCAHLAQVVREACEEYDAPADLVQEIENELGVLLARPSSEEELSLVRAGLLP